MNRSAWPPRERPRPDARRVRAIQRQGHHPERRVEGAVSPRSDRLRVRAERKFGRSSSRPRSSCRRSPAMCVVALNETMVTAISKRQRRAGGDAPMMEAFDAWELRWIARHLPTLDAAWLPPSSLDPALSVVYEHDVYLLAGSDRINLKVRHRENSLKLKRLLERTEDGFERWRTEFDVPLPAGPERFREVLDLIGRAGSAERLGAVAGAGEVVEILAAICDPSQLVGVHRLRATCSSAERVTWTWLASGPPGAPTVPWGSRAASSATCARSCRTWDKASWAHRATTPSSSRTVAGKATGRAIARQRRIALMGASTTSEFENPTPAPIDVGVRWDIAGGSARPFGRVGPPHPPAASVRAVVQRAEVLALGGPRSAHRG